MKKRMSNVATLKTQLLSFGKSSKMLVFVIIIGLNWLFVLLNVLLTVYMDEFQDLIGLGVINETGFVIGLLFALAVYAILPSSTLFVYIGSTQNNSTMVKTAVNIIRFVLLAARFLLLVVAVMLSMIVLNGQFFEGPIVFVLIFVIIGITYFLYSFLKHIITFVSDVSRVMGQEEVVIMNVPKAESIRHYMMYFFLLALLQIVMIERTGIPVTVMAYVSNVYSYIFYLYCLYLCLAFDKEMDLFIDLEAANEEVKTDKLTFDESFHFTIYGRRWAIHIVIDSILYVITFLLISYSVQLPVVYFLAIIFLFISSGFSYYTYRLYIKKDPLVDISKTHVVIKRVTGYKKIARDDVIKLELQQIKRTKYLVIKTKKGVAFKHSLFLLNLDEQELQQLVSFH
jgi:hypothetical protein